MRGGPAGSDKTASRRQQRYTRCHLRDKGSSSTGSDKNGNPQAATLSASGQRQQFAGIDKNGNTAGSKDTHVVAIGTTAAVRRQQSKSQIAGVQFRSKFTYL